MRKKIFDKKIDELAVDEAWLANALAPIDGAPRALARASLTKMYHALGHDEFMHRLSSEDILLSSHVKMYTDIAPLHDHVAASLSEVRGKLTRLRKARDDGSRFQPNS